VGVLAAASLVVGCRGSPPPERLEPVVEVAGCAAVRSGGVCELDAAAPCQTLRLWVDVDRQTRLKVHAQGRALAATEGATRRGRRLTVCVPREASRLELRVELGRAVGSWSLALRKSEACADEAAALELRRKGESARALAQLDARAQQRAGTCDARVAGVRGRLLLDLDRAEEAVEALSESVRRKREAGLVSGALDDTLAMAHVLTHRVRDFRRARAALRDAALPGSIHDEGRARLPYYRGRLDLETGNLRAALQGFAEAEPRAERLGMARLMLHVRDARIEVLETLGRHAEARTLLDVLLADDATGLEGCDRAGLLVRAGWLGLLTEERPSERTRRLLGEAVELRAGRCRRPHLEANARLNLALAALREGDADGAALQLAEAARVHPEPDARLLPWWRDLEGRLALLRGEGEAARRVYEGLLAGATAPEARWRARVGRAHVLDALGRGEDALADLVAAERVLDEQQLRIPLGEGRGAYLGDRARSARALVDLLLRLGRPGEACDAARRARGRVLAALRAVQRVGALDPPRRRRWEDRLTSYRKARTALEATREAHRLAPTAGRSALAAQLEREEAGLRRALDAAYQVLAGVDTPMHGALAAPARGTVLLVYHPVGAGWAGFAKTDSDTMARRLGAVDGAASPAALARMLLEPFGAALEEADRIHVLAYGGLLGVDVHALPWRGRPLAEHREVAYASDLPGAVRADPEQPPRLALVVADPGGNLRGARGDAERTEAVLRARPAWTTLGLRQRAATRRALLAGIGRASLLHFSGHARFAGAEGWESRLELAGRDALSVGDILSLPRVPPDVVLSGCETARTDASVPAPTLGLGHAFLAAGALRVVATARPVEDALAARFGRALYRHGFPDVASAFFAAQRTVAAECGGCDWAAYRLLVP